MATEDFDIDALAAYLHLTPTQVLRLASRDKLPGRKISGEWKFSRAEVHHWLEDQIGLSDEVGLEKVESVLQKDIDATLDESIAIEQLLPLEAVAFPLKARTRRSVISSICELAANTGLLWDPDKMAEAIHNREQLHPTALDNGVALLHPRRPLPSAMGEPFLALGVTHQGIPFGGPRGNLTDIFFLIGSVSERGHLRTLARISRLIASNRLLKEIREKNSPTEVLDTIIELDREIYSLE